MRRIELAGCIAVGSELLGDRRLDTNSLTIARTLARFGVRIVEKRVLGDDEKEIAAAIGELLGRVDLVVVTGGLGPTADDVTRAAVAKALHRQLEPHPQALAWIRGRYAEFGREMPEVCNAMALAVPGARLLRNTRGTAPGMLLDVDGKVLAVFPGVPREMELMLERDLVPELAARNPEARRLTRTLLVAGVVESEIEGRVRHLYERFGRENVTILAAPGVVRLVLAAAGDEERAAGRLDEMEAAFSDILGDDLAGVEASGLPEVILTRMRGQGITLATAESCTGGLVGKLLTDIPGASDVYSGGVISYSNRAKERLLGVRAATLSEYGAVSDVTAREMAEGVRERFQADWGLGITGIAGPDGGTAEKPVGLVYWAAAGPRGTWHRSAVFPGDRGMIRTWSANAALDLLRRTLLLGSDS